MICGSDEEPRLRQTTWQEVLTRSFMVLSHHFLHVLPSAHLTHCSGSHWIANLIAPYLSILPPCIVTGPWTYFFPTKARAHVWARSPKFGFSSSGCWSHMDQDYQVYIFSRKFPVFFTSFFPYIGKNNYSDGFLWKFEKINIIILYFVYNTWLMKQ